MEIYFKLDERIIATTIPSFDRKKAKSQKQIRIKEDGVVVIREFQINGLDFKELTEWRTQVSTETVSKLISKIGGLMKILDSMPTIDDSGSRNITLYLADGTLHSIQFPNSGGRKHPAKKPFDDAWNAIQAAAANPNSEQDVGLKGLQP